MKSGLDIKNLDCQILKNINISLEKGTFNCLIGKSGSGKTTLFKCIAGILKYDGQIKLAGYILPNDKLHNEVGINLNTINLSEGSVFDNLQEPLKNLKRRGYNKCAYEIADSLGISNLLCKNISELSYSNKKIVSIAKSLVHQPSLILLDNPFESIDESHKSLLIKYLQGLNNKIIIFTTNDSEDLLLCNNLIVMNDGMIIDNDIKERIFENENLLVKNGIALPFIIELSSKLISYGLLDKLKYDMDEMVNILWK